jgi:hypothetical protein
MNELTNGSGDEASLFMGTLMGNMEGGDHLPGTLREESSTIGDSSKDSTEGSS